MVIFHSYVSLPEGNSISLDPALCCDVAVAMWRFTWPSLRAQDVKHQPPLWRKFHPGFSLCLMLQIPVNFHEFHTKKYT